MSVKDDNRLPRFQFPPLTMGGGAHDLERMIQFMADQRRREERERMDRATYQDQQQKRFNASADLIDKIVGLEQGTRKLQSQLAKQAPSLPSKPPSQGKKSASHSGKKSLSSD